MMNALRWIPVGAVVFALLSASPAMARPVFQSDLICDVPPTADGTFNDLFPQRPYIVGYPNGDLWISQIRFGPAHANTDMRCEFFCNFPEGFVMAPACGRTDEFGTLPAQRLDGFLKGLGTPFCGWPAFHLLETPFFGVQCVNGFPVDP